MQLNLCTFLTEIQSTENHYWNKNLLSKSSVFSLILLGYLSHHSKKMQ